MTRAGKQFELFSRFVGAFALAIVVSAAFAGRDARAGGETRTFIQLTESVVGRYVLETEVGTAFSSRVAGSIRGRLGMPAGEENLRTLLGRLSEEELSRISSLTDVQELTRNIQTVERRLARSGHYRLGTSTALSRLARTEAQRITGEVFPTIEFIRAGESGGYSAARAVFLETEGAASGGAATTLDRAATTPDGVLWDSSELIALLERRGVTGSTIMPALETAASRGLLGNQRAAEKILLQFAKFDNMPFVGALMRYSPGVRDRVLGNPNFFLTLLIEEVIGSATMVAAEYQARGDRFWEEFDMVAVDVVSVAFIDFALVYLLSPRLSHRLRLQNPAASRTGMRRFMDRLPSNAFESSVTHAVDTSRMAHSYGAGARVASFFVRGAQFAAAGAGAGLAGSLVTDGLFALRDGERDGNLPTAADNAHDWGRFMAISSNTRYQFLNGLENMLQRTVLRNPVAFAISTFILRSGNTYAGAAHYTYLSEGWKRERDRARTAAAVSSGGTVSTIDGGPDAGVAPVPTGNSFTGADSGVRYEEYQLPCNPSADGTRITDWACEPPSR